MTPRFHVLPAADRDLDDQADYLARKASIETALRSGTRHFGVRNYLFQHCSLQLPQAFSPLPHAIDHILALQHHEWPLLSLNAGSFVLPRPAIRQMRPVHSSSEAGRFDR
jgi:hypothetical protein